jgi:uncharacterized protein with HEPN domain
MYDLELVRAIVRQILGAAQTVGRRFAPITESEDFVRSEEGLEKLDAICMQLIVLGESVRHLDRVTGGTLLSDYPQIEWRRIMGMRDVLSHPYFDLDAEAVYAVCANHMEALVHTAERMLADLEIR